MLLPPPLLLLWWLVVVLVLNTSFGGGRITNVVVNAYVVQVQQRRVRYDAKRLSAPLSSNGLSYCRRYHLLHHPTSHAVTSSSSLAMHRRGEARSDDEEMLDAQEPVLRNPSNPLSSSSSSSFSSSSRRNLIVASMAGITSAELAWRQAVNTAYDAVYSSSYPLPSASAAETSSSLLPKGTIEQLQKGKAVVIPNWLSKDEVSLLRQDCQNCFENDHFTNFVYSKDNSKNGEDHDPKFMPSFFPRQPNLGDGPFVNPDIGNYDIRQDIKARMALVKAELAMQLSKTRPTLAEDIKQTHELEYIRYDVGGYLKRHVDERHIELKRLMGAQYTLKPNATRRSITWLIYLNDDWNGQNDGGHLRVYERTNGVSSNTMVGANGRDLQIGWLAADGSGSNGDLPIFLDPLHPTNDGKINPKESCKLYYTTSDNENDDRIYLSSKPFPNAALYISGGESMMIDNPQQLMNFRRIDTQKSALSSFLSSSAESEDPSERPKDIVPNAGTLVMFDSVSLPHQVLKTNRERYGVQGWFHEKLYSYV